MSKVSEEIRKILEESFTDGWIVTIDKKLDAIMQIYNRKIRTLKKKLRYKSAYIKRTKAEDVELNID